MTDFMERTNGDSQEVIEIKSSKIEDLHSLYNRADSSGTDGMELYNEVKTLYTSTRNRSERFKFTNNFFKFSFIVLGSASAALGLNGGDNNTAIAIIGFSVAGIQSLLSVFPIGDRSVLLNHLSNKLRRKAREIRQIIKSDLTPMEKSKRLDKYYDDVEKLDEAIFNNTNTTNFKPSLNRQISPAASSPV
jgi:hypothetical protein